MQTRVGPVMGMRSLTPVANPSCVLLSEALTRHLLPTDQTTTPRSVNADAGPDRFQDSDGFHQYSETRQGRQNGVGYGYFTWRYAQTEMNYPADAIWVGKSMIQVGTYEVDATTKDYRIAIQRWVDKDTIFFDQFGGKAND